MIGTMSDQPPEVHTNAQGVAFYRDGDKWVPMPSEVPPAVKVRGATNIAAMIFIALVVIGLVFAFAASCQNSLQKARQREWMDKCLETGQLHCP